MGVMKIIDRTGDTVVEWDIRNEQEVAVARSEFERLLTEGRTAYGYSGDSRVGDVMDTFDPAVEQIVSRPQVVGG